MYLYLILCRVLSFHTHSKRKKNKIKSKSIMCCFYRTHFRISVHTHTHVFHIVRNKYTEYARVNRLFPLSLILFLLFCSNLFHVCTALLFYASVCSLFIQYRVYIYFKRMHLHVIILYVVKDKNKNQSWNNSVLLCVTNTDKTNFEPAIHLKSIKNNLVIYAECRHDAKRTFRLKMHFGGRTSILTQQYIVAKNKKQKTKTKNVNWSKRFWTKTLAARVLEFWLFVRVCVWKRNEYIFLVHIFSVWCL